MEYRGTEVDTCTGVQLSRFRTAHEVAARRTAR
jgi:hypothetical protein